MNDPRFPARRVNLVEEPIWNEHWDPSDKIMGYASDNAYDEFHYMKASDLEQYVDDLATHKTKGKKAPKKFSSPQIQWFSEQVKEGSSILETTRTAILDALTWMYEVAYMPHASDIERAMDRSKESVISNFSLNLDLWEPVLTLSQRRRGPKEWAPRKRLEEREVLESLLKQVSFEQEENHYDRFLVFDFRNSQVVKDLLSRSEWRGVDLVHSLSLELRAIERDYIIDFFDALVKEMDRDVDITSRTDWRRAWKSMLDSGVAYDAQKEMAAAVKEMPPEGSYDDA